MVIFFFSIFALYFQDKVVDGGDYLFTGFYLLVCVCARSGVTS